MSIKNIDQSPFVYGRTVVGNAFTNREKEREKLQSNLLNGISTMVLAPRRWGKSSLVEAVVKEIDKKNPSIKVVVIDLYSVSSEVDFLEIFAKEVIKASSSRWEDWVKAGKQFFRQLVPKISFGAAPGSEFSMSFDFDEATKHRDEILNLPEAIGEKKNTKYIICLDEFQDLASFPNFESLEKNMRAVWQRQQRVTFCLYGSKRHLMKDIFNRPDKPFYRFGDLMMLSKISTDDWVRFISKSFKNTYKRIDKDVSRLIPKLMDNHPWYVQQLCHYTWQIAEVDVTRKDLERALQELISANTPFYQSEIENLSKTQINLLNAVIKGETKLTSASVMQKYHLGTPRNVSKNRDILIRKDIIDREKKEYFLMDPAFQIWFRKQFFNEDYSTDF